jgi:hypothetical protein
LLLWLLSGERYGFMSDELYFLDAGQRLDLGYVDFPPLIAWLAGLLQLFALDSLQALRGVTAIVGVVIILLGADLARRLGGSAFAQWATALLLLFAPGFASVQSLFTMNVFDQLCWCLAFWLALRYLQEQRPGWMLALGAVLGFGVLTKLSILALCLALPFACVVWARELLLRREVWAAAGIALLIASPYVGWQFANDWPFLDFISAYNSEVPSAMVLQNPALGLLLTMNPAFALVWAPGAVYCLVNRDPALRLLGTAAWFCLGLFLLAGVKFYFAVPLFLLFAPAGALFWDRWPGSRWAAPIRLGILATLATGLAGLPMAVPLLPQPVLQQVADFLRDGEQGFPGAEPAQLERYFPHFAEMHGWPELVELTARSWESLSPEQRATSALVASHYGHAAALNRLDTDDRLPEALGRHMTYHLWSAGRDYAGGLYVGFSRDELQPLFGQLEELGRLDCSGCMAREQGLPVFYVEGPRLPPAELRMRLRRYYFF